MNEEIIVYWTSEVNILSPIILPAVSDVVGFTKSMGSNISHTSDIRKCPSIINLYKNTFVVKSPIQFDIGWTGSEFFSKKYSKEMDRYIVQRNKDTGFLSVSTPASITLLTEEPSLKIEYRNAVYGTNDFCNKAVFIEGELDIGKWYRPSDLAFFFRNKNDLINVNAGDSLFYIKFITDKKVVLKKYLLTSELYRIRKELYEYRGEISENYGKVKDKLEKYYSAFENSLYKKRILEEIKNNLLE